MKVICFIIVILAIAVSFTNAVNYFTYALALCPNDTNRAYRSQQSEESYVECTANNWGSYVEATCFGDPGESNPCRKV